MFLWLSQRVKMLLARPVTRRVFSFVNRYSTQLGFAFLTFIFLMVTVGEGQAYEVPTPKLAAQFQTKQDGFIGKPQLLGSQTILTGEVQQQLAIIYTVEKGDTILSIANRYNLSAGTIIDANNLSGLQAEKIKPGSTIIIPAQDTNTSLAWLDQVNKEKEAERLKAEQERQKQLAQQNRNRATASRNRVVAISSEGYQILGTMWGSYNGGMPGWCTWYVHYRRPDLPNGMGNANSYIASARAAGYATGSVPRRGAVIQTRESGWGHVAIVDAVNGDMITLTEMNYVGRGIISRRTISAHSGAIVGYIY